MENNFSSIFGDLFGNLMPKKDKDCCENCIHYYYEGIGKCRLFRDTKPYPKDDKCMLYTRKKENQ